PSKNYSSAYGIGSAQSMSVDDAYNLWLLDGDRIGVLRPGEAAPRWFSGIGHASQPFGDSGLALGSTRICGGSAGRAYVGYRWYDADDLHPAKKELTTDPEYLKGDV